MAAENPNWEIKISEDALTTLNRASFEAARLGHKETDTPHLLWALLDDRTVNTLFDKMAVETGQITERIQELFPPEPDTHTQTPVPTPEAKAAVAYAQQAASIRGAKEVDTIDLLCGILLTQRRENFAAHILQQQHVTLKTIDTARSSLKIPPTADEIVAELSNRLRPILTHPGVAPEAKHRLLHYIDGDLKLSEKNLPPRGKPAPTTSAQPQS